MLDAGPVFYLVTSAFVFTFLSWYRKYADNHAHLPLPPGPPILPIVGSIFSLEDRVRTWLSFSAWRSTYGDIIYTRILNKQIVVINSEEVAKDLFEGRSSIYSDKPQSIVYKAFGMDIHVGLMPYGDRWRLHRRIFHQHFRPAAIPNYHPVQLRSAHKMLFSFLQDPTNYTEHFQMFTFVSILSVVYDHEPKAMDDQVVRIMQQCLEEVPKAMTPGATLTMEAMPFLLRLPTWFPGAVYKRASVKCLLMTDDVKEVTSQMITKKMSNGHVSPCMVADAMTRMNGFDDDIVGTAIKEAACVSFAAAAETSTSTFLSFLLAMVLHPEVQAKAQADIDRVVGKDRLPDFDDRPALPYVDAITRETLRWYPVFPLGVPHSTTTSDTYKGYFIPKGVSVIANTWAMTRDETKYPNPDAFRPERFLHDNGSLTSDTMSLGFGWGRRACVGEPFADAGLFIGMASFLAAFSVHHALDEHGNEIPVIPKFTTGFMIRPETFPCRIVPRFRNASVETLTRLTGSVSE